MANPRYNTQTTNRRGAMNGGRMKKMGGDVKKIKKAFGPKMSQAKKQKMKKKKSFPDLNKDGKVTFADVLKGRGVNKKA